MRRIVLFGLLWVVVLTLGCISETSQGQTKDNGEKNSLEVLVYFDGPLGFQDLQEQEIINKLELDLQSEFSDFFLIEVKNGGNFMETYEMSIQSLVDKSGLSTAKERMHELGHQPPENFKNDMDPIDFLKNDERSIEIIMEYDKAVNRFEENIASSNNLAQFDLGQIGLLITPSHGYGAKTVSNEKWSLIYTGLVEVDFPPPESLKSSLKGAYDYGNPVFDPYRASYDLKKQKQYIIQYIANSAKKGIGQQFGLEEGNYDLRNAMRGVIDRDLAEHFIRDDGPVHFDESDFEILVERINEWSGGSG